MLKFYKISLNLSSKIAVIFVSAWTPLAQNVSLAFLNLRAIYLCGGGGHLTGFPKLPSYLALGGKTAT